MVIYETAEDLMNCPIENIRPETLLKISTYDWIKEYAKKHNYTEDDVFWAIYKCERQAVANLYKTQWVKLKEEDENIDDYHTSAEKIKEVLDCELSRAVRLFDFLCKHHIIERLKEKHYIARILNTTTYNDIINKKEN